MTLRLATGPVSWGVDFAGAPDNPPWVDVVAGIDAAGYRWTELGPVGYLPPEADEELARRGIGVIGGFVFEPLADAGRLPRTLAAARLAAGRIAAAGGRFLVIIDAVGRGRDDWRALAHAVLCIAEIARDHGLRPVLHPHAGTHVERPDEVEPLLEPTRSRCTGAGPSGSRICTSRTSTRPAATGTSGARCAPASSGRWARASSTSRRCSRRSTSTASTAGRWSSRTASRVATRSRT
jgi:hypothetical protein